MAIRGELTVFTSIESKVTPKIFMYMCIPVVNRKQFMKGMQVCAH